MIHTKYTNVVSKDFDQRNYIVCLGSQGKVVHTAGQFILTNPDACFSTWMAT